MLLLFFAIGALNRAAAAWALAIASMAFYAWWDVRFVPLLSLSIVFNFLLGREITQRRSRFLLIAGIAANLALLGWFKYAGFFVSSVNQLGGTVIPFPEVTLPLGISFFTFTQIAFLVDAHAGRAREYRPSHYFLFVTFFPHLIAGPLYHHGQVMPQFEDRNTFRPRWDNLAVGSTIFIIGLAKKVLIADSLAPYADGAFSAVHAGQPVLLLEAWIGALAYTFQIYFDFSGYSDMAIGLARMFNVRLPANFASPYKARSLIDLWQRWHMTLAAFLRRYVYEPLGGKRKSRSRRYAAIFATMLLGGLWHGANWTFVLWGAVHGALLLLNYAWRRQARTSDAYGSGPQWLRQGSAWALTFLAWILTAVIFRAESISDALAMFAAMSGANGISLPGSWQDWAVAKVIAAIIFNEVQFIGLTPHFSFGHYGAVALTLAAAIALFCPNSQELLAAHRPIWNAAPHAGASVIWRPALPWSAIMACLLTASVLVLSRPAPFLYFQF